MQPEVSITRSAVISGVSRAPTGELDYWSGFTCFHRHHIATMARRTSLTCPVSSNANARCIERKAVQAIY